MTPLRLTSEPCSPSGSMVASTLTRAVRNSTLSEWSILLRETLQNSVDARLNDRQPVTFRVTLDYATSEQQRALREQVFAAEAPEVDGLNRVLKRGDIPLLTIADWGTRGLGGPTRADLDTREATDYRDFFLNVGREEKKDFQGGTYGLGRGVLFYISESESIVVYTRTRNEGSFVTRLMAMALSPSFARGGRKHTGRHWWGAKGQAEWPEPIINDRADALAAALGLDVIPEGKTGTAILVVAPRIPEGSGLEEVLDAMIDAASLYGWPLMLGRRGRPSVKFEFGTQGTVWEPLPPDAQDSRVRHFVEAYRIAEQGTLPEQPTSWHVSGIDFGAGRAALRPLGTLAFRHFPPTGPRADDGEEEANVIPTSAVALMRDPRMVVRYLPVPKHPMGSITVGVFIADTAFDHQFAESEPVAHDDWIPAKLDVGRNGRNPVRQALAKIKECVKATWVNSASRATHATGPDGIAPVIGDLLGGMVADTPGFGGLPLRPDDRGPHKPSARVTRATAGPPELRIVGDNELEAVFPVEVLRVGEVKEVTLKAEPRVVLDSGVEPDGERPTGADSPTVTGWEDATTRARLSNGPLHTLAADATRVMVAVSQPRDTAVTVQVDVVEVEP